MIPSHAGDVPVPVNETLSGDVGASVVNVTEADFAPTDVGVNVMVIVQVELDVSVAPQVVDLPNIAALVPVSVMLEMFNVNEPVSVSVIV
jgi:hypothetical protein